VVSHPHPMYNPLKGGVSQSVVSMLAREFKGVSKQNLNSKCALIFAACVLQKSLSAGHARDIKHRVERRLTLWIDGHYNALVHDVSRLGRYYTSVLFVRLTKVRC
jgi:hypothetical protein